MLARLTGLLALLAALSAAAPAQAQPWTGERWVRGRGHRLAGELGLYTRNELFARGDQWAVTPNFRGRVRLVDGQVLSREAFLVDLEFAWRAVGISGPADSFRVGNPYVGVMLGWRAPTWRFRAGAGTTAPLTNAFEDGPEDYVAYALGQAMHGGWDAWLLEPEIQPLVLRADFELHGDHFQFGGDVALGVAFPVRRAGLGGDPEVAFQTGVFGAGLPIPELAIGARMQVFFATNWRVGFGGVDEAQLALIPFIRMQLEPMFVELRLLMNLDDPYGFAFDNNGVWAVSVLVGGRF